MAKENLIATTKELIAAPSCCAPLKEKAQAWIDNPDDKNISEEFIAELEGDITDIDGLLSLQILTYLQKFSAKRALKNLPLMPTN